MASEEDDEKTEQASQRRLQQAFEEGNVAVARDAAMLATLAVGGGVLVAMAASLRDTLVTLVHASVEGLANPVPGRLIPYLTKPSLLVLLVPTTVVAGVVVALGSQTHLGMWAQLAMPDFTKVFSFNGIKRLFNKDTLIDLVMAGAKVSALAYMLWTTFRATFLALPALLHMGIADQLAGTFRPIGENLARILTLVTVMAGADFALVQYRYRKRMKMTKDEAKREYKDEAGDPMIRARRRRRHRELAKGQAKVEVPKADALIVNPTHIAIAIRYRPEEDTAPRVTAKGKGVLAESMRDLAREHGIPIVQDIPLARLLYKRVKVGRCVPAETFKAVAAVLAYVYRVLGKGNMQAGGRG